MMKFFRKHTKHLLAFFMALLLVVWLLDDTIRSLGQGNADAGVEWGQVYGQAVGFDDVQSIRRDTELMEGLRLPWNQFWGGQIRRPLELKEWYMLDAEARRRGIYVPQENIDKVREAQADLVERVRNDRKASLDEIDHAIQSFLRVQQAFRDDVSDLKVSEADIQNYIRDTAEKAKVKLVMLTAEQFSDKTWEPTDEELKQQFEKYKDKDPGTGDDRFGYRLPEEVQIEYIQVQVDKLAKRQAVSDEEAYDHWKKNMMPVATQPGGATTTSPARPYWTFTDGRDAVTKKLQTEKAKKEALRIGTELAKALSAAWVNAPKTQPGDYREPPAEALDPQRYTKAVDSFRSKIGDVLEYKREQFHDRQKMYQLGPVASATALRGSQESITLSEAAFLVQGLEASPKDQPKKARWFHNLHETLSEPFVENDSGNVYVFRTLAARPKRAAESWEVKKEDLKRDLRLSRGAEQARQQAEQLLERARRVGLEEAVKQDAALVQKLSPNGQQAVKSTQPFARKRQSGYGGLMPTRVPEAGSDTGFAEAVFAQAATTATQPSSKVTLYTHAGKQRWVVFELVDTLPVTHAEYEEEHKMAEMMLQGQQQMEFASAWLQPKSIRDRVSFKSAHPEQDEKPGEEGEDMQIEF